MLRSIISVIAGYATILFLSGFPRMVLAFYMKTDIRITGAVPDTPEIWNYGILALDLFAGVFGALITATLARKQAVFHLIGLAAITIVEVFVIMVHPETSNFSIFMLSTGILKTTGIFVGYQIHLKTIQP